MLNKSSIFVVLVISFICRPIWAGLKSCSEEHDKLEICLKGKEQYNKPFPVVVYSDLYLREIIEINEEKNWISIQLYLEFTWNDASLSLSNTSAP